MALDAETFADLFVSFMQEEMEIAYPNVLKNVRVDEVPQDDGSVETTTTDEFGPIEIDTEKLRPMGIALGRAIVGLLKTNAVVSTANVQAGGSTITGRIT